ncbi:MAG: PP2C family protein-serine/threonine phosphatase [Gammaproteobacteria bacterium]
MSIKQDFPRKQAHADDNRVESLSALTLGSSNWLQRAQLASQVIFDASGLALVAEVDRGKYQLAGLAFGDGQLLLRPPEQLEFFSTGKQLPGLNGLEAAGCELRQNELEDFEFPASIATFLPWYLGMQPKYGFVLFGVEHAKLAANLADRHEFLAVASNLLRRATKRALVDAAAWIEAEIKKLATLQNLLQPADLAEISGVAFAVHSRPHEYAGGDYYDIAQIEHASGAKRCLISVADVSGHGPAAVVETAMIDSILRTFSTANRVNNEPGPAEVMTYLNRHMFTRKPRPTFATMFASQLDVGTGILRYCLAGHPPPIFRSADRHNCGAVVSGDGIPLQIIRDYQWEELSLDMAPGDLIVAYSDGVTETLSPGGVQFGMSNLVEIIESGSDDPQQLLDEILDALASHADGRPFHDDQTVVIVKRCNRL